MRRLLKKVIKISNLIVRNLFLWMLAIIFLLPIAFTIVSSFMGSDEILKHYGALIENRKMVGKGAEPVIFWLIPEMVSASQYQVLLFFTPEYLIKFWNSLILVLPITFFELLVSLLAAYGFMRYKGRVREILFFAYLIVLLLPFQVTLVPNYIAADYLHILDTRWAIWLPGIFSPFAVFLLTRYMRMLPQELWDAAKVDGAGEWQIFVRICVPLCNGIVIASGILIFVEYWNMVEQPILLLADEAMHPLSVFLSSISTEDIGIAFAAATLYMIPSLLLFLYGRDELIEGIAVSSSIKG